MKSIRVGPCICGVLSTLALCNPPAASAQSNPDPCGLLTQAEVGAATGASVGPGHALGETCNWTGTPRVIVSLWYPGATMWQSIEHPNAMVKQVPAPGLGDTAFYNTLGGFATLGVKKGTTDFVVKVYGITDLSKQMSIEKSLAQSVLTKM